MPSYLRWILESYIEMFPSEGRLVRDKMDKVLDSEGITQPTRRRDLRRLWRSLDGERLAVQGERIDEMRRNAEVNRGHRHH